MDHPAILLVGEEAAAAVLREVGHEVVTFTDNLECLAKLDERWPDVVVLDATMGPLSVLETCQRIKRNQKFTPVMVLSPRADIVAKMETLRAGADDFLTLPCDSRDLCVRLEVLIRTKRSFDLLARASAADSHGAVIEDDSERDRLTGLGNQRFLTRRLEVELGNATRGSDTLSVMAVDLDKLDDINSRYGRGAGDRLIVACARVIERACRDEDIVARAGGDEFVAILPRLHFAGAAVVAERVCKDIGGTVVLDGSARIACQASVGVASYPGREIDSSKDLLRFAHAALARAKAEGRGQVCLYQHHGYLIGPAKAGARS